MKSNDEVVRKVGKLLSLQRRQMASRSLENFARVYLGHYFKLPPSRMHQELFAMLHPDRLSSGSKLAIAAPRGHAKSTLISLAHVLSCICLGTERFILLISSTADQAESLLRHIKDELSGNALLLQDFPEVCEAPGSRPAPARWTLRELITRNDVKVTAMGVDGKLRGRRHKADRPSLIICDDLETDSGVASEVERRKLHDWFYKVVLNSGAPDSKFIVIGTVLHYDALLATLIDPSKSPGWTGHKYQAVEAWDVHHDLWDKWAAIYNHQEEFEGASGRDAARRFFQQNKAMMLEGSKVLWPEREDYYALRELRMTHGQASFDSEKQNEPIDSSSCLFPEDSIHYWDGEFRTEQELLAFLGPRATVFGACDPSMGKAGKARDDSAIITLVRDDESKLLYVLDADIVRLDPTALIDRLIEYQSRRNYCGFAMETTQFQEFLAQELRKRSRARGYEVPIKEVKPVADKIGRIQSLQPLVASSTLRFSKRHRALLDQLRHFPKASHDDGPDALQMAVRLATEPRRQAGIFFATKVPLYPGCNTGFLVLNDDQPEEDIFTRRGREFFHS